MNHQEKIDALSETFASRFSAPNLKNLKEDAEKTPDKWSPDFLEVIQKAIERKETSNAHH